MDRAAWLAGSSPRDATGKAGTASASARTRSPNFPWVLLDRALLHYDSVVRRAHARRGTIALADGGRAGLVADFARGDHRNLEELFRKIRREAADPRRELRDALEWSIGRILRRIDPVPGDARAEEA